VHRYPGFPGQCADVLGHSKQQLTQTFRLRVLRGTVLTQLPKFSDAFHLGDTVHQAGNRSTKLPLNVIEGDVRILDHIVQHGCGDGFVVQLETVQNLGHGQRVMEIGFARRSSLSPMPLARPLGRSSQ
jgi:hypothetical protein